MCHCSPPTELGLIGWGDDLVHEYLTDIEIEGWLGVLRGNKDYGCEWDSAAATATPPAATKGVSVNSVVPCFPVARKRRTERTGGQDEGGGVGGVGLILGAGRAVDPDTARTTG
jgi:hypothetical protein